MGFSGFFPVKNNQSIEPSLHLGCLPCLRLGWKPRPRRHSFFGVPQRPGPEGPATGGGDAGGHQRPVGSNRSLMQFLFGIYAVRDKICFENDLGWPFWSKEVWKLNFRQYMVRWKSTTAPQNEKMRKGEDTGAREGRKVAKHGVFPMFCGSGGSKSRLAKAAPAGQMKDEKLHVVVVRSTVGSKKCQNTKWSDHFHKLSCWKSARRCGAKHIFKSKCTNHTIPEPLL